MSEIHDDQYKLQLFRNLQQSLFTKFWGISYRVACGGKAPPPFDLKVPAQMQASIPGATEKAGLDLVFAVQMQVENYLDRAFDGATNFSSPLHRLRWTIALTLTSLTWLRRWNRAYKPKLIGHFVHLLDERMRAIEPGACPPPPTVGEMDVVQGRAHLIAMEAWAAARMPTWNVLSTLPRVAAVLAEWAAKPMPPMVSRLDWKIHSAPIRAFLLEREPLLNAIGTAFRQQGRDGLAHEFERRVRRSILQAYKISVQGEDLCWINDHDLAERVRNKPNLIDQMKAERAGFPEHYQEAVFAIVDAASWLKQVAAADADQTPRRPLMPTPDAAAATAAGGPAGGHTAQPMGLITLTKAARIKGTNHVTIGRALDREDFPGDKRKRLVDADSAEFRGGSRTLRSGGGQWSRIGTLRPNSARLGPDPVAHIPAHICAHSIF